MKHNFKLPCMILATALAATLHAAVPLAWEARPNAPAPASFDRHHGETIDFRCTLTGFDAAFAPAADVRLWYQTNGMGQAWWSTPATVQSNVITATWSPALDPGADRVSLFFGAPSNVYASAVLRLRHSPGFAPSELTLPVQRLDFAAVELCNISALTNGWRFGTEDAVRRSGDTMSGALTIGTRDQGVFLDPSGNASLSYGDGAIFLPSPYYFTLAGLENGRIVYRTIYYPEDEGQLALTSDIPAAPGNYAAVSNAAMSAAAQTNDFLRLTGGSMRGPICFPYANGYGVSISSASPGALSFDSTYPGYSGLSALLDLTRIPTDAAGSGSSEIAFISDISFAATAATNYTDLVIQHMDLPIPVFDVYAEDVTNVADFVTSNAISTNNPDFVSAVLAAPIAGADQSDLAEIGEYGSYGTVGAAILALIAGLAALKRGKADKTELPYDIVAVTPANGVVTVQPRTVAIYTAQTSAVAFEVAVGTVTGAKARDCELVIDCTATGAVAPTVTWPATFHPRTDAATDFACEAGKRNVYFISEFAPGEFAVGGWQETAGGNA